MIALLFDGARVAGAEEIRVAVLKSATSAPVFIALDRGYFEAQGFEAKLVPFDATQGVAVAVVTGNAAFGAGALTAGFYSLASQGELRLIAGGGRAAPTYRTLCYAASAHAWADGLTAPRLLAGHAVAVAAVGAPGHYALGLLAEKYGFDLKSVHLVPLASFPNIVSALAGNRVDGGLMPAAPCLAAAAKGAARIVGWAGDETPWQTGGVFATALAAEDRPEFVARFIRAYVMGADDYAAAFTGPDGGRRDGPGAADALAIIARHLGVAPDQVRDTLGFFDAAARIDRADVTRQVAWYKAQGLLKPEVDAAAIIEDRYVK